MFQEDEEMKDIVKNRCDLPDNIDIENDIINSSHINKIIIIIDHIDI